MTSRHLAREAAGPRSKQRNGDTLDEQRIRVMEAGGEDLLDQVGAGEDRVLIEAPTLQACAEMADGSRAR